MSPERMLIVENAPYANARLDERLTALCYKSVGRARDGEQALALARQIQPALVLMDAG